MTDAAASSSPAAPAQDQPAVLDTRGLHCPLPVMELAKAIEGADAGTLVEVWSDDPSSRVDIPVWVRLKHHELVGTRELEPGVQAYVVRAASATS